MGKSSSTPTQQNVKTETSNLPEYARPYFENIMQRAQAESYRPYTPYEGQRIADFTPEQLQTQQNIMGMQTPGQFGQATNFLNAAGLGTLAASQYNPYAFSAQQITPDALRYYQMQGPDSFTQSGMTDKYMSPYIQAALEPQLREARMGAKQTQLAEDLGAARQGAYGGSRALLAAMERERNLGQNLSDIRAKGYQTAFEQAQGQFNTEQQARQNAALQNLQAMLGVQRLGAEQSLAAQQSNQQYGLDAQKLSELSRQFAASNALSGYGQLGQLGQTMTNLGQAQQNADLARLAAQQGVGAEQQAMEQKYLDTDYADFLRQRDYVMEQLGYFSNLMRGIPVNLSTTTTSYAPPPSMLSQVAGAGLGAAGLYNMYKGG